jgi:hypothetical protein
MINDLWYKNAIVYCLSVGTYMDANADGIGDFQGLIISLNAPRSMWNQVTHNGDSGD